MNARSIAAAAALVLVGGVAGAFADHHVSASVADVRSAAAFDRGRYVEAQFARDALTEMFDYGAADLAVEINVPRAGESDAVARRKLATLKAYFVSELGHRLSEDVGLLSIASPSQKVYDVADLRLRADGTFLAATPRAPLGPPLPATVGRYSMYGQPAAPHCYFALLQYPGRAQPIVLFGRDVRGKITFTDDFGVTIPTVSMTSLAAPSAAR
jgi:hypothetical protein